MILENFFINQKNTKDEAKSKRLITDYQVNCQSLTESLVSGGISHINFIILGNSLSSGYSMSDKIKPFFDQNGTLKTLLEKQQFNYQIYNFGLIAGNSNANILALLNNNASLDYAKTIFAHYLDFADAIDNKEAIGLEEVKTYKTTGHVPVGSISDEDYDAYYKIQAGDQEIKVLDLLKNKEAGSQNIVIINGYTGELMDMIFRGGQISLLPKYLKNEFRNMYALLKTIIAQDNEVMIVVGAVPQYSFTGGKIPVIGPVISAYNHAIKENVQATTNSYLTKPINIGIIHNNEGHIIVDCHGNQVEYLDLSNSFVKTMADQFLINKLFTTYQGIIKSYIETYNTLPNMHYSIDYGALFKDLNEALEARITNNPEANKKLLVGLQKFIEYYNIYYHDDYYPTNKKEINSHLKAQQLILKKSSIN